MASRTQDTPIVNTNEGNLAIEVVPHCSRVPIVAKLLLDAQPELLGIERQCGERVVVTLMTARWVRERVASRQPACGPSITPGRGDPEDVLRSRERNSECAALGAGG